MWSDLDMLLKKLSARDVWKNVCEASTAKAVMNLGDVDGMSAEGCRKLSKERSNLGRVKVQEQQGAWEEEADLPDGDEAMLLLTFLDPSKLLDETPGWSSINKVLPPSGGDEEDGNGNSPIKTKECKF